MKPLLASLRKSVQSEGRKRSIFDYLFFLKERLIMSHTGKEMSFCPSLAGGGGFPGRRAKAILTLRGN